MQGRGNRIRFGEMGSGPDFPPAAHEPIKFPESGPVDTPSSGVGGVGIGRQVENPHEQGDVVVRHLQPMALGEFPGRLAHTEDLRAGQDWASRDSCGSYPWIPRNEAMLIPEAVAVKNQVVIFW
jgi:hypothetical protein